MGRQPRGGLVRKLVAFLEDVMVGTLAEADDLWRFDYDPVWASRAAAFDLLSAVLRSRAYSAVRTRLRFSGSSRLAPVMP